jgi:uncharacterized membrane protein
MNSAHIHLILNHFPIVGIMFAIPILFVAWWKNNATLSRVGMSMIVASGALTLITYLTGEPAEGVIEHLPGVLENRIERHEEAAEKTLILVGITSLAAIFSLLLSYRKSVLPKKSTALVIVLSLGCAAFLAWTNNLGGEIHHPEIREQTQSVSQERSSATKEDSD